MLQDWRVFPTASAGRSQSLLPSIRELATEIGPRPATSKAEAEAAAVIAGLLRRSGLEVTIQPFVAAGAPSLGLLLLVIVGLTAMAAGFWLPLPSGLLAAWAAVLAWRELRGPPPLATLLRRRESQNVIGTRAATDTPYWRVVLLCQLDTAPVLASYAQRFLRAGLLVIPLSLTTLAAMLVSATLWRPAWLAALGPGLLLLLAALVLLWRARWARWAPGAVSAAGPAIAAAVAGMLQELEHVELWVIAGGAVASSGAGTLQVLKRYPFPQGETCFLSLPALGRGRLTLVTPRGALGHRRSERFLQHLLAGVAADQRVVLDQRDGSGERLDSSIPLARGHRAVSLAGIGPNGLLAGYRAADDDPDSLDDEQLEAALRLITTLIRRLEGMEPT